MSWTNTNITTKVEVAQPQTSSGSIKENSTCSKLMSVTIVMSSDMGAHSMSRNRGSAQYTRTQIEIIPCKVCGDKSSGVHYGIITCEGFFRRSQSNVVNYQCPRQKNCVVDRVNRNRCQFCRLQKCLGLGMSRDAVKFGRMSKKQREKVEDEVRYHRAQLTTSTNGLTTTNQLSLVNGQITCAQIPGQTIINSNTSSSISMSPVSIYLQPNNNAISTNQTNLNSNSSGFDMINSNTANSQANNSSLNSRTNQTNSTTNGILINGSSNQIIITQQSNSSTPTPTSNNQIADPSPDSSVFEPQQSQQPSSSNLSVPYNGGYAYNLNGYDNEYYNNSVMNFELSTNDYVDSTTYDQRLILNGVDAQFGNNISPAELIALTVKTVGDAHLRTCLYTTDEIADAMRKPQDARRIAYFKGLPHEELWLECASKLTVIIQQIIEFAKMVPGFMKLLQDDQIVLLKTASFELSCIRMSRFFDLNTSNVLFGDLLMPRDALMTSDPIERKLVQSAFELAKSIAELKLTENELGLYSAYVLLSPDRPNLKGVNEIVRLNQVILKSLKYELNKTHKMPFKEEISVFDSLLEKLPQLREISSLHMESLCAFRKSNPHLVFPDLHKELFSVDI